VEVNQVRCRVFLKGVLQSLFLIKDINNGVVEILTLVSLTSPTEEIMTA
jgi:hypothetical protein